MSPARRIRMSRAAETLRGWVPRWWRGEGGRRGRALDGALAPAEHAFRAISGVRNAAYDRGWIAVRRGPIPVISIGNLSVGGSGKTPFTAWVADRLAREGRAPAIVMRGYGADEIEVHRELNPGVPVFAAPGRIEAVRAAAAAGRDVAVLDDAFQHRAIHRDLDIVLVSAETWGPRRRLLPRGPWREPGSALARADIVVVTRKTATPESAGAVGSECRGLAGGAPVVVCHLAPTRLHSLTGEAFPLGWLARRRVLVVASLADPRPLVDQLEELGAEAELLAYPDHHEFTPGDVRTIRGRSSGRTVVCTRKEAVKLRGLLDQPDDLLVLDQNVVIETGASAIDEALDRTSR